MAVPRSWIPNALTLFRVLLIPAVLLLVARTSGSPGAWGVPRVLAVALFALIAATDWLDGLLARRLHAESRLGSLADAVADRLALLAPLLYLAVWQPPAFPAVPLWVPLWLVALDAVAGVGWLMATARNEAPSPRSHNQVGRVGAWLMFLVVLGALAGLPRAGLIAMAAAGLALASASVLLYLRRWFGSRQAPER